MAPIEEFEDHVMHRASAISDAITRWLDNEGGILERSVEQTVTTGLFPRHDVLFMLNSIRETVLRDTLIEWARQVTSGSHASMITQKDVLCLHAGNLPLVGFQDVIGVLLSGHRYIGKLSSKDPWLMDSLLRVLKKTMAGQVIRWSTSLEALKDIKADCVLFAGSERSVPTIQTTIDKQSLAKEDAGYLIRTARFSIIWLQKKGWEKTNIRDQVVQAMLRYEGKGCRSAAVIIAPQSLSQAYEDLKPAIRDFVKQNKPAYQGNTGARYWKSYLRSVGKSAFSAGSQVVTDEEEMAGRDHMVCWIQGGDADVARIAKKFGSRIQQIYQEDDVIDRYRDHPESINDIRKDIQNQIHPFVFEYLSRAQTPDIDWKPDGEDVMAWLLLQ